MAVIITQDLLPANPAYNDSIIKFYSDTYPSATRAEVVIGGRTFDVIPFNGIFTFNLKEIVKTMVNPNKFEDAITPDLTSGGYLYTDSSIRRSVPVTLRVIGSPNDVLSKSYIFFKSVEQLPDYHRKAQINPVARVFLPTTNFVDYYCTYHEGYPFDFAVYIPILSTYQFKNITTGQSTPVYSNLSSNVKRVFLSDGANSVTTEDILPLSSTLNKIELWSAGQFRANIYIKQVESDCGIQLKWLNRFGSYSYWKFDRAYKSTITPKTIDDFQGRYDNLQNLTASSYFIGKTATQTMSITCSYTADDAAYLQDLVTSPSVWMNVNNQPFIQIQEKDFFAVKVNDTPFEQTNTKMNKGKLNLTITLPDLNTQTN
jgi:hypothetical protein